MIQTLNPLTNLDTIVLFLSLSVAVLPESIRFKSFYEREPIKLA